MRLNRAKKLSEMKDGDRFQFDPDNPVGADGALLDGIWMITNAHATYAGFVVCVCWEGSERGKVRLLGLGMEVVPIPIPLQ